MVQGVGMDNAQAAPAAPAAQEVKMAIDMPGRTTQHIFANSDSTIGAAMADAGINDFHGTLRLNNVEVSLDDKVGEGGNLTAVPNIQGGDEESTDQDEEAN